MLASRRSSCNVALHVVPRLLTMHLHDMPTLQRRLSPGARRASVLGLYCCVAAACSADSGSGFTWNGTLAESNGRRTITNPATPALPSGTIRATSLWRAPAADLADWAEPSRIAHGAGNYYDVDRRSTRVHVIASDGQLVKSFGKRGPGPGEIMVAGDVGFVGEHVVVRDMGKHTIEVYSPDGTFIKSIPLGRVGFGFTTIDPDGIIAAQLAGAGQKWIRVTLDGTTAELPLPAAAAAQGATPCARVATFGDRVAQLDCAVPVLTVSDQAGVIEQVIVIDRDTVLATDAQLQTVKERMQRDMASDPLPPALAQQLLESTMRDARVVKPWRGARRDRTTGVTALWEQMPANLGGGNARLHLLSPDGVYLDAIDFDDEWLDFAINDSRVAALAVNDSTGLPQLAAHSIAIPKDVLEAAAAASARKKP